MKARTVTELGQQVTVLTFDLYGTVVDMQTGLTEVATPFLRDRRWSGDPRRFVTWWRRTHFEDSMIDALCDRGHTRYREIGRRAVSHVMDRAGIDYTPEDAEWLVEQIEKLRPFPEVLAALERMRPHFRLVILSNGDRDMLDNAAPWIGFEFERLISVEEAGYFKPHRATYEKAAEIVGVPTHEILHVANHTFDCIGAKAAGMRAAFIDRRRRPYGHTPHKPDIVVENLAELAEALTP